MNDELFEDAPKEILLKILPLEKEEEQEFKKWEEKLLASEIDVNNLPPSPQPLLFLDGCCILRRQRMAVITGKAGSRKTSFLTLLCSAMGGGHVSPRLKANGVFKGVYLDTEQPPDLTAKIKERLKAMGGEKETRVFNTLDMPKEFLIKLVEYITQKSNADYIILDNGTDIFDGVMNEEQASFAGRFLRQLAVAYDICVICVVHQNEGESNTTPRGWIGRELIRKSYYAFLVKNKPGAGYSELSFPKIRESKELNPTKILHDEKTGFPMLEDSATSATSTEPNPDKYADIVREIPPNGISYTELSSLIMSKTNKAESTANKWVKDMINANVISKDNDRYYARQEPFIFSDSTDDELPF